MTKQNKKPTNHYYTEQPKSKPKLAVIHTNLKNQSFRFMTSSSVFSKKRVDPATRLLIQTMILPEKGKILDLGCGYGPIGIAAAKLNPNLHVFMTDINRRAIRLAKKNIKLNQTANATVKQGSLYQPVRNMKFQTILTNPPISAGMKTVNAIITEAPKHLNKNATLHLTVRSKIAGKRIPRIMKETFGNTQVLARKGGYRVLLSKN